MRRQIASALFLVDSVVIGLGAFGHGAQAAHLHRAIDQFPIEPDMHSMLYVVWYFISGCMLVFGAMLLWVWQRFRMGDGRPTIIFVLIGVLYTGIGVFGFLYRDRDPFMAFFVVLGVVLLASGSILAPRTPAAGLAR